MATEQREAARDGGARAAWPAAILNFVRAVEWRNAPTSSDARSRDRRPTGGKPSAGFLSLKRGTAFGSPERPNLPRRCWVAKSAQVTASQRNTCALPTCAGAARRSQGRECRRAKRRHVYRGPAAPRLRPPRGGGPDPRSLVPHKIKWKSTSASFRASTACVPLQNQVAQEVFSFPPSKHTCTPVFVVTVSALEGLSQD